MTTQEQKQEDLQPTAEKLVEDLSIAEASDETFQALGGYDGVPAENQLEPLYTSFNELIHAYAAASAELHKEMKS